MPPPPLESRVHWTHLWPLVFIPRKPLCPVALSEAKIRLFSSRNVTDANLSLSCIPGTESLPWGNLPEVHIDFGAREFICLISCPIQRADSQIVTLHICGKFSYSGGRNTILTSSLLT